MLLFVLLFLQAERISGPEIQGIRMSRELTDGLVLQPQVVQEPVEVIRDSHLRGHREERKKKNHKKYDIKLLYFWPF